ncbi:MAG: hypothetical protein ACJ748_04310, partial [Flavisolibacter sp.]
KVIGATTDYYLARQDNSGHQPLYQQNDKYWSYIGTKGSTTQVWNATENYPSAGAMTTIGNANKCAIYGMYTENGQTHTVLNGVTVNIGGYQGTTVVQGMYASSSGGDLLLNNGIQANAISFGNGTSIYQDANGSYGSWDFSHPTYIRSPKDIYIGGTNPYILHLFNNKAVFGGQSNDNGEKWQFYGGNLSVAGGNLLLEDINHHGSYKRLFFSYESPSAGSYNKGDLAYNSLPEKNGLLGWRCIKDGTPGTWEPISFPGRSGSEENASETIFDVASASYTVKDSDDNLIFENPNGTRIKLPSFSGNKALYLSNQSAKAAILLTPVFKKSGNSVSEVSPYSWIKIVWDNTNNKWWLMAGGTN